MNTRTRTLSLAASLAVAAPIALALAQPALASGGPGGGGHGGGAWTCGPVTTTTLPGLTTQKAITVGSGGVAVIKRDAINDGLLVGRVTANPGWTKSVPTPAGPKVTVQFQQSHMKVELEAAQSALYYGPTVLVTEVTTCTR